jgi:hypothetical protein
LRWGSEKDGDGDGSWRCGCHQLQEEHHGLNDRRGVSS